MRTYPGPSCCRWCTCWPGPGGWRGCLAGSRVPEGRRGCSIEGSSQGWCPCQACRCRTSRRTVRTARHSGEGRATPCTGKTAYKKDMYAYRQTRTQIHVHTHTHTHTHTQSHRQIHTHTHTESQTDLVHPAVGGIHVGQILTGGYEQTQCVCVCVCDEMNVFLSL